MKKIKPFNNLHLIYLVVCMIPLMYVNIFFMINFMQNAHVGYLIGFICNIVIPISIYLVFRLLYCYYYVITDDYISKYKGKVCIFKIKKDSLKGIIIKKGKWYQVFKVLIQNICYYELHNINYLSAISFLFDEYIVYTKEDRKSNKLESLKTNMDLEFLEYTDSFKYSEIKRICKLLAINKNINITKI